MKHTVFEQNNPAGKKVDSGKQKKGRGVYFLALLPVLSVALYLLLMSIGQTENFAIVGILIFIVMIVVWGFAGALFARNGIPFGKAVLVGNAFPLLCAAVYTILYIIAKFADSEALVNVAEVIGGLGMGMFGLLGTMLYVIIPLELFEVYINLVFTLLIFACGFAIGTSGRAKKKPLGNH